MYASLIGAGISQLYDYVSSATSKSSTPPSSSSFAPSSTTDSGSSDGSSGVGATGGNSISGALQKLMVDLQASTSAGSSASSGSGSADPTSTIEGDLKSVFGAIKGHGHHGKPHGSASDAGDAGNTTDQLASSGGSSGGGNRLSQVATSLMAYAKSNSLGAGGGSSTSLSA